MAIRRFYLAPSCPGAGVVSLPRRLQPGRLLRRERIGAAGPDLELGRHGVRGLAIGQVESVGLPMQIGAAGGEVEQVRVIGRGRGGLWWTWR